MVCGNCKGTDHTVAEVRDCYAREADFADQQAAEIHAEAMMSFISGGGDYMGAKIYASVIASGRTWDEYLRERDEEVGREIEAAGLCEHGLSAALCVGPSHYPMDM